LQETRLACAEHNIIDAAGDATTGLVPSDSDVNVDITEVKPNVDIPDAFANIIIEEQANISICSDHWRNPSSPDYDMKVPVGVLTSNRLGELRKLRDKVWAQSDTGQMLCFNSYSTCYKEST
jgi:hypothetical protein